MIAPPLSGLIFHHIGIACRNLAAEAAAFAAAGYAPDGDAFEDPAQGIRGQFLSGGGPRLELVAPLGGEKNVLAGILAQGTKMYHLAFTTADLDASLAEASRHRAKIVVDPVPAVAFGGNRIAFFFLPNLMLVELIERGPASFSGGGK
jgi:methylmalonyl-CoA/ethylmalonyl-CoA epimerase